MFECFTLALFHLYSLYPGRSEVECSKFSKTSRRCCGWKIACYQQINILCLFARRCSMCSLSMCAYQLNVFFALRFYLLRQSTQQHTYSFTEKFYNKWHFLGFMKRDGWWCYLALDVFLSCVCARWWFQYILLGSSSLLRRQFFSLLLWTQERRNKKNKNFLLHFSQIVKQPNVKGCCNDVRCDLLLGLALKSWFYAQ